MLTEGLAECLNGTIVFLQKWGDSSMAVEAPGWEAKVFHAKAA
jgi:hypothetical protein